MQTSPSGTGLGSSGSFTVCLINAILRLQNKNYSKKKISEIAFEIEHNILREPVGKQDQYACAVGGVNQFYFNKNNSVSIKKINLSNNSLNNLKKSCYIFYRLFKDSYKILNFQNKQTLKLNKDMIKNLDMIKEIGKNSKKALEKNFNEFGEIMNYHWQLKKKKICQYDK